MTTLTTSINDPARAAFSPFPIDYVLETTVARAATIPSMNCPLDMVRCPDGTLAPRGGPECKALCGATFSCPAGQKQEILQCFSAPCPVMCLSADAPNSAPYTPALTPSAGSTQPVMSPAQSGLLTASAFGEYSPSAETAARAASGISVSALLGIGALAAVYWFGLKRKT